MQYVLVVNHHSLYANNIVADTESKGKQLLDNFFKTWQQAVNKKISHEFIICDGNIGEWRVSNNVMFYEYLNKQSKTNKIFILKLLDITKKSTLDYFSSNVLDIIQETGAFIPSYGKICDLVGSTSLQEDTILLSIASNEIWDKDKIIIEWSNDNIESTKKLLPCYCNNFAYSNHVDTFIEKIASANPFSQERFSQKIQSAVICTPFWEWFVSLDVEVQNSFVSKAIQCEKEGWIARKKGHYQQIVGDYSVLSEIRIWTKRKTLRSYIKRNSDKCVVFIYGSDKDNQNDALKYSYKYYIKHKDELDLKK